MEVKRYHVMNMQELYNPATFLDSSCFSEFNLPSQPSQTFQGSQESGDTSSSYYYLRNVMAAPQRKVKAIAAKRRICDPPIVAGMQATPIPPLGYTMQQCFLSEAIGPSVDRSIRPSVESATSAPLLFQAGQIPGMRATSTMLNMVFTTELKNDIIIAPDLFIDRLFPKDRAPFIIESNGNLFKTLAKKGFGTPRRPYSKNWSIVNQAWQDG
jgi:hypothetical protein